MNAINLKFCTLKNMDTHTAATFYSSEWIKYLRLYNT